MNTSDIELLNRLRAKASPDDRRIAAVAQKLEGIYYPTDCRDGVVEEALGDLARRALEDAPTNAGRRKPGRGVIITAESGQGKSRIVGHALDSIPIFGVAGRYGHGCVTLRVRTPKPCSGAGLGLHVLDLLGYPLTASRKAHEIWRRVRQRLCQLGVMFLWIDEFQHLIDRKNLQDLRDIRDTLKSLLEYEEWPIYVIITGLPHLVTLLQEPSEDPENDIQAVRRYAFLSLPGLELPQEMEIVERALTDLSLAAELSLNFADQKDLQNRLVHTALGRFGLAIEIIRWAIAAALLAGDATLHEEHFARMYEKRTGSTLAANPFVVEDWRNVDCKAVLQDPSGDPIIDATPIISSKRRRRRA
jgi:hypothetical protein